MSIDVSSDSTIEVVVRYRNLPLTSSSRQNKRTTSSQQCSSPLNSKEWCCKVATGKWGARISHNNKRYRLGSCGTEIEAARAYDRATMKIPRAHSLNFPRINYGVEESAFQSRCSIEEVLNMLRDKTYSSMLMNFKLNCSSCVGFHSETYMKEVGISYDFHFTKELGHMDVSHKCFLARGDYASILAPPPHPQKKIRRRRRRTTVEIYDICRHTWTFECSYCHQTGKYAPTSGCGKFLQKHNLKEKDLVTIYRCRYKGGRKFYLINVLRSTAGTSVGTNAEEDEGHSL